MEHYTSAATGFADESHAGGVPAEAVDVLLDPVEGEALVEKAGVRGGVVRSSITQPAQEAECCKLRRGQQSLIYIGGKAGRTR